MMNNTDKVDQLIVAFNDNYFPNELRFWLLNGFQEYRKYRGYVTLDKILGLRVHGQNSTQYNFKKRERDAILRELAEFYTPGGSAYNQAVVLIKQINHFQQRKIEKFKQHPKLLDLLPYGQKKIFELLCLDIKTPKSKTGLMNIIKK